MDETEFELFDRGLEEATSRHSGSALDERLAQLGWRDALTLDHQRAISRLFEHQGRQNATSSALAVVLAASLGAQELRETSIVLPPLGPAIESGTLIDGRCVVQGLAEPSFEHCDLAIAVVSSNGNHLAIAVETRRLTTRAVGGLDPAAELLEVTGVFDLSAADRTAVVNWMSVLGTGQRALGHELVGTSRAMLSLARRHSLDRIQFDRPISTFQAVRHRLADCLVAIEAADALLAVAWDEPTVSNASIAKAFAGHAARLTGRHCQQVLAGMGFTRDHPFHRYLRRAMLLDQLLGSGASLTHRLGAEAIATRHLPPVVTL